MLGSFGKFCYVKSLKKPYGVCESSLLSLLTFSPKQDGADLPPAIGFDVSEVLTLPPRQQSFLVDPSGQDLVREFLTQYFAIYDSDSRQQLLEAYHENAIMSMATNYLTNDNRNSANTR